MSKPTYIDTVRPRLDDNLVGFTVPVPSGISGYTFLLTIEGQGTLAGVISDATAGEVTFDPSTGLDIDAVVWNSTELALGSYSYYVVMTDILGDERTIVQGKWLVVARGV